MRGLNLAVLIVGLTLIGAALYGFAGMDGSLKLAAALERLGQPLGDLRVDVRAAVDDVEHGAPLVRARGDRDVAAGRVVADAVLDQVRGQALEHPPLAPHRDRAEVEPHAHVLAAHRPRSRADR